MHLESVKIASCAILTFLRWISLMLQKVERNVPIGERASWVLSATQTWPGTLKKTTPGSADTPEAPLRSSPVHCKF